MITVSVGLACFDPSEPQGQQSPADQETSQMATNLISRADKALYQAKDAGRSRFVSLV